MALSILFCVNLPSLLSTLTQKHTPMLSSASPVISLLAVWILPSALLLKLPYSVNKHLLDNRLDTIFLHFLFPGLSVGTISHIIPSRPPPLPQVSLILCTSDSRKWESRLLDTTWLQETNEQTNKNPCYSCIAPHLSWLRYMLYASSWPSAKLSVPQTFLGLQQI